MFVKQLESIFSLLTALLSGLTGLGEPEKRFKNEVMEVVGQS